MCPAITGIFLDPSVILNCCELCECIAIYTIRNILLLLEYWSGHVLCAYAISTPYLEPSKLMGLMLILTSMKIIFVTQDVHKRIHHKHKRYSDELNGVLMIGIYFA